MVVDGVKSGFEDVTADIPLSSGLGPLLFILYISDIKDGLEWRNINNINGLSLFHKIHLDNPWLLVKAFMPDIQPKIHNTCVSL